MISNSQLNSITNYTPIFIPMRKSKKNRGYRLFLIGLYRILAAIHQLLRMFDLFIDDFLKILILTIIFLLLVVK